LDGLSQTVRVCGLNRGVNTFTTKQWLTQDFVAGEMNAEDVINEIPKVFVEGVPSRWLCPLLRNLWIYSSSIMYFDEISGAKHRFSLQLLR